MKISGGRIKDVGFGGAMILKSNNLNHNFITNVI